MFMGETKLLTKSPTENETTNIFLYDKNMKKIVCYV